MKKFIPVVFILIGNMFFGQDTVLTKNADILMQKTGDLDNDGINEKVEVINTSETTEYGTVREIRISKFRNNSWEEWKSSKNAILNSEEGGMMGDPFQEIEIKNGILLISFYGGSSWKWSYRDKYRFQNNEFQLIGHESHSFRICEFWENFDFNISTGRIIYTKEIEECEGDHERHQTEKETFYQKGIKINLGNRNLKSYKIISPEYKRELFL